MKTWIVSPLNEETIKGEETIQGRKLYEEIRYIYLGKDIGLQSKSCTRGLSKQTLIRATK